MTEHVQSITPHNLDAERSVLGSILIDNAGFAVARDILDTRDYFRDAHRKIHGAIARLIRDGQPAELVTLTDELQRSGELEDVGGPAYVASLVDGIPHSANIEAYARIVRDHASRRQLLEVARRLAQGAQTDHDLSGLTDRITVDLENIAAQTDGRALASIPATWALTDDAALMRLPDPEYLVDNMIGRRALVIAYGPPGSGKTTFAALSAVAVATGRPLLGHRVKHPGCVAYIGPDDPGGWKPRVIASKSEYGLSLETSVGIFMFAEPFDLLDASKVDAMIAFLRSHQWPMPLELVIVDTYAAVSAGTNENSSEDMTRGMVNAQRMRTALNASILILHHTNASGSRERGHSAMRGAADTMLVLTPSDDIVKLECSKQRNGGEFRPLTLKLVPRPEGGCVLRLEADTEPAKELTTNQRKALDALVENFGTNGATKTQWQSVCAEIADRTFHRACLVLCNRGFVQQTGNTFRPAATRERAA